MCEQMYMLASYFQQFHPLSWTPGTLTLHCLKIKSTTQQGCIEMRDNTKCIGVIKLGWSSALKMLLPICVSRLLEAGEAKLWKCCMWLKQWSYFPRLLLDRLQLLCEGLSPPAKAFSPLCCGINFAHNHKTAWTKAAVGSVTLRRTWGTCAGFHGPARRTVGSINIREGCSFQAEKLPWASWHCGEASSLIPFSKET